MVGQEKGRTSKHLFKYLNPLTYRKIVYHKGKKLSLSHSLCLGRLKLIKQLVQPDE